MKKTDAKSPPATRPVHIELPPDVYDALSLAARDNDRSLRKEVVFRLKASLAPSLAQKVD